jgi:diadenosine tetraphosphate (Ap4A) HIT family hydrolase
MQDTENPIIGLYVMSPKRHIRTRTDLTIDEKHELFKIICTIRESMEKNYE